MGVRAVVAESYERIHRSNLIGRGVLPLEFTGSDGASSYTFTGEEELTFEGVDAVSVGSSPVLLRVTRGDGRVETVALRLRIFSGQELSYLRHGGILPYVVRRTLDRS
ncbi:hypothetical protein [Streptomyces phaeolivaceus]|uniref:hypothetical protein n=1 Tax=Streptomyces phaeolivaceus TaxID=2653200 RepID=UPI0021F80544|nr:hypothetical protein [Streptomyces phaeolivaceus]